MTRGSLGRVAGGAALVGGTLAAYALLVRPWQLRWGATREEFDGPLPGDDLVPDAKYQDTHAITIHAPAAQVWPWLAQIGQDRGGFYSYAFLENLLGCHLRNADRTVPEWQGLRVGDSVWLHPRVPPLPVLLLDPGRALVLGSNTERAGTWGFFLKEIDARSTRLLARGRSQETRSALGWLGQHCLFEPAHFFMERRMLLGIKERAESTCLEGSTVSPAGDRAF
jgi:hypothetical protein